MKRLGDYQKSQLEAIQKRYKAEETVMQLIAAGNVKGIEKLINSSESVDTKVFRLPQDPIRDRKNGLIIRNTLFRIAAKNGGLPPVLLHYISEKYALLIERANSLEYLDNYLANEQLIEYTEAVQQFSTLGYSDLIKNVVSYMTENLTEPLSLQALAEEFHVHPAHLSRKFKKETKQTITDYIHIHRVKHATLLLEEGKTNMLEVANLSGFNSSSYFNRIFKKVTNQTPSAYIKKTFK